MNQTVVVAAVIEREGRILICQRRADQPHPGKWEFPGGKVEPGEPPEHAIYRELREELGIHAYVDAEITRYEYTYPGRKPILLIFYRVKEFSGEMETEIFAQTRWERRDRLPRYDFLEADLDFVKQLAISA
jgi:8-oxo-dGTP diphosphatase